LSERTRRQPTIQDVARAAGVATGTVSNVLNGGRRVAPETRQRVLDAIQRLGYSKNSLARGLRTRRTETLGLLLPTILNPFFPALARGVEDTARRHGYTVFLCSTDRHAEQEGELCRVLLEKRVDGLVVVSPVLLPAELLPPGVTAPLVIVEGSSLADHSGNYSAVTLDTAAGIAAAVRHLYNLGHRHIGYVRGPVGVRRADERWHNWQQAAVACGLSPAAHAVQTGDFTFESGYTAGQRLICRSHPPTAIVAANDLMALGVMKAAYQLGLSIPQDLSVVGFDDISAAAYTTPALTTVAVPKYEQGAVAVDLLLQQLSVEQVQAPQVRTLTTHLEVRGSTGPCQRKA
jgi:DNA-binding LacI/PurR family transcriptional regulator